MLPVFGLLIGAAGCMYVRWKAFLDFEMAVMGEAGFEVKKALADLKGEAWWNARVVTDVGFGICLSADAIAKGRRTAHAIMMV